MPQKGPHEFSPFLFAFFFLFFFFLIDGKQINDIHLLNVVSLFCFPASSFAAGRQMLPPITSVTIFGDSLQPPPSDPTCKYNKNRFIKNYLLFCGRGGDSFKEVRAILIYQREVNFQWQKFVLIRTNAEMITLTFYLLIFYFLFFFLIFYSNVVWGKESLRGVRFPCLFGLTFFFKSANILIFLIQQRTT